ncbi:hypothetical protein KUCAC02_019589, partial [Chaenocephalus aceratus]
IGSQTCIVMYYLCNKYVQAPGLLGSTALRISNHTAALSTAAAGKWLFKPPDHVMPQSSLDKLFDNNKK